LRKLSAFVDTLGTFWLDEFGLRRYRNKRLQRDGKSSDFAKFLYIDDSGGWWIGTDKGELENFQGDHKSTKHYSHSAYNSNSLSHDDITSIVQDNSGRIWIGTVNGLNKFDLQKDKITRYLYQPGILNTLTANRINALCLTNSGEIWIGTHGDGLYNFNLKTEKFMHYVHDSNNPNSLSDNVILSIYEDRSGMIWVGTFVGGINRINPNQKKFSHSHHDPENPKSISYNMITSIFEDTSGVLWIGTDGGGLNKINTGDLDISTPRWTHYKNNPYNPNSISGDKILSIYQDRMGDMWVGTAEGGLNKFLHSSNEKSSAFIHYKHFPGNPRSLSTDEVTCIYEDISNQFWIGTGRGLNKFNRQTETFISYHSDPNNPKSLSNDGITCIYEDRKANMWVGTENGLNKFDRQTETFSRYIYDPENPISRIYNEITSIYEDKSGILWVGSATGLNRFDQKNDVFLRYTKKDGLPDNVICGILEDDDKNLWLSTKNGLSKFSLRTGKFRNFDRHDGLQSNEFNDGAYCKTNSGHLIFGGVNGLSYFYPKEKRDNPHRPPIVITDFQISNISVPIGGQFIKKSISETKEIQLSYEERVFSFEFAALDFQIPEKNQYAYMLEGFDREWIYTDATRRFATYTNLDPGEYIFKVKGSNNQGLWNETGTSINITITPPWWLTNWAYAVYFILVVITLYALRTYDQKRQNLKLELELEHLHTKKLEEIDRMKSRFFANISHEFRTPLTLILGPIERMISGELQENLHEQYKLIRRNGKRLLQLINQLLDLSKLESDKLKLKTRATDIIHMINGLVQAFESLAAQKNITLNFKSEIDSQEIYLDVDKFEKIINNLLFNAFKFTPENGNIEILVCTGEAFPGNFQNNPQTFDQNASPLHSSPQQSKIIEIFITNTGPGIPKDKIDKIFDRFYQVDDSYTKDDEGTGIGLALTKELVELHHGTIDVHCTNADKQPPNSPFSMGDLFCTTFTVSLPFGKDHLKPEEIVEELEAGDRSEQSGDPDMSGRPETGKPISQDSIPEADTRYQIPDTEKHISNPESRIPHLKSSIEHRASSSIPHPVSRIPYPESRILLVEDNADLRHYIRSNMDGQYRFSEAENGEEGFKKAKKDIPDLIISDVMMPKMDGFEFCANIKTDERTSHIPVILMTARAEQEDKLEGLETGADDYITKPFDNKELLIRVKNLIEQRRKMRERFTRESSLIIDKIAHTSTDEKFVNRVINIISQHISEANFNVESLTEEIGMSRMHLHRKILGLFGQTPGVFLRTIRLKRGAELLKEKSGNISEISYEVGFDNPSYFGLCFRRQFGLSPSDYCKKSSEQLKCYKI
jgi:signal transduction histidine kinase/ligand-binding sensor domain-containing protein/DNA-binding response OmpR family regulator